MQFERSDRVSEEIKKELSDIIQHDLKDPRLCAELISIVKVNMSKDLRHAKVYVSIFDKDKEKVETTMKALENAKPYIRREISRRISLRFTPEITFELDDSIEYGARISQILNQLNIPKEDENIEESEGEEEN
ncbi:ribosome-binding factor A [Caldicellulosiruptor bescii]|uniref:Ribosome-binding factor A n=2 Tax=Caldicellulosiruptor bescii TaxID=31899 RepID=RBFA_CALBD|nr:30S ribosome-binding factor RbfA [Caldicellulosiruptor bescii]B9MR49.1 RecName: Full=Ribosome-binding factor A [Caldicellulosiruptor bescii DSM 6725]ACM60153.1 ribosome-binding factor A [Caldicellulosiruptor bescii DSM 6725]PBC87568.1 ribosome-binding factor A [Caldicellulosiruptor bescii]PBC90501.1 ribosome-binding factor A [Caldicellulosiruptor bescii]PBD04067.1 ribosome-binding factor A [Caldicellulosiruptor bescii]PBD06298.1 ribosome-binding factor A [Caldicellulosiruptor bescii]